MYIIRIISISESEIHLWDSNNFRATEPEAKSHRISEKITRLMHSLCVHYAFILHSLCIHYAFICIHYAFTMHSLCIHYAFMIFMYYEDCDVSISYEHDLGISR